MSHANEIRPSRIDSTGLMRHSTCSVATHSSRCISDHALTIVGFRRFLVDTSIQGLTLPSRIREIAPALLEHTSAELIRRGFVADITTLTIELSICGYCCNSFLTDLAGVFVVFPRECRSGESLLSPWLEAGPWRPGLRYSRWPYVFRSW
jgi:hypothetical protein